MTLFPSGDHRLEGDVGLMVTLECEGGEWRWVGSVSWGWVTNDHKLGA